MSNLIKFRDDILYINANITNRTSNTIFAEYDVDLSDNYLDQAGLYYVSIVRFDIPNIIPLFNFIDNTYQVVLRYNNTDFAQYLVFQNVDHFTTSNQYIWSYQQFLNIANDAFKSAFTALKTAFPGAPPAVAPYIVFDPVTKLMTFVVEDQYDPVVAGAPTVEIYWNHAFNLFYDNSLNTYNNGVNLSSGRDYQLIVQNYFNNYDSTNGVYNIIQEVPTTANFFDFSRIVIQSNQLPIVKEYLTTYGSNGGSIQTPVLTDFIPTFGVDRTDFIYNANPLRFIDLDGNTPIKHFGFKVFWITKSGQQILYELPPGYSLTIKFGFYVKNQTSF